MFDQIPDCWDGLPDKVSAGGELGSQERAVWDNGDIRLTSKAVLLAADTDRPKVIPLEAINEVKVDYGCLVLCAAEGDVWSSVSDNPEEPAALVRDEVRRVRLAQGQMGP